MSYDVSEWAYQGPRLGYHARKETDMSFETPEVNLIFAGCGSAFAGPDQYQTNMVLEAKYESGVIKRLLIDCGTDAKFSLKEIGLAPPDIDAVYISHQHGDHTGGLEWLGFATYFGESPRPKLICDEQLMTELWENGLKGSMTTIPGKTATLSEYFECHAVPRDGQFFWANMLFSLAQTVHVCSGMTIKYSYGLVFEPALCVNRKGTAFLKRNSMIFQDDVFVVSPGEYPGIQTWRKERERVFPDDRFSETRFSKDGSSPRVLITCDTRHDPELFRGLYGMCDLIIHDCETAPYRSGVHPSYEDLCSLSDEVKGKMLLCHYQPTKKDASKGGFLGFATKGQRVRLW